MRPELQPDLIPSSIPGSALDVEYGTDFDLALITNFLHHLDPLTGEKLLAKVGATLKPGGRVVILEFVPNEDRVSPPIPAALQFDHAGRDSGRRCLHFY